LRGVKGWEFEPLFVRRELVSTRKNTETFRGLFQQFLPPMPAPDLWFPCLLAIRNKRAAAKLTRFCCVELHMSKPGWTPSIVPNEHNQTVYLV
jgi:hypothetical protein